MSWWYRFRRKLRCFHCGELVIPWVTGSRAERELHGAARGMAAAFGMRVKVKAFSHDLCERKMAELSACLESKSK